MAASTQSELLTPALEMESLCCSYGAIQVLHSVSLHVECGEIVAMIGSNGAGKSTLINSVFAQPRSTSGKVSVFGHAVHQRPTHTIPALGVALVPEGRHVFAGMTVYENLAMGTLAARPEARQAENQILADVMHRFPILRQRQNQRAGTLSGGEQQMLAIGRALMSAPKLILLDEPSLGLAPLIVKQIFAILKEIAQSQVTIFLVEQNAQLALRLAHRGYVLANGRIVVTGTGQELLENPMVREAYLGA